MERPDQANQVSKKASLLSCISIFTISWEHVMTQLTAAPTTLEDAADGYADLERLVSDRVNEAVGPLFTTDAHTLWDAYLENLTPSRRQHYNCSCCRRFIEKFGGLVTIDESGQTYPVLWSMLRRSSRTRSSLFTSTSERRSRRACSYGQTRSEHGGGRGANRKLTEAGRGHTSLVRHRSSRTRTQR